MVQAAGIIGIRELQTQFEPVQNRSEQARVVAGAARGLRCCCLADVVFGIMTFFDTKSNAVLP